MAAERAELSALFLQRAREALAAMQSEYVVFNFGGKDNAYNERIMDRPPTADQRNLMIIAATALDKHMAAERFDDKGSQGVVNGLIDGIGAALRETFGRAPDDPADDGA